MAKVVVVIEDEPQISRFICSALENDGFVAHAAFDRRSGLIECNNRKPDLAIVDLGLPDGDGVDVIRQLRTWTAMPVIVLSARTMEASKVAALDAGADDYLTKPFSVAELQARIRAHLRRYVLAPDRAGTRVRFGTMEADLEERRLWRDGEEVHLTPIEFRLLTALIRHAGRVVTHRQLLAEVWGPGHSERGHYLRVYMGHLRQKIEADPAQPRHILTEVGVGYRFEMEGKA